jgi:hypothetical protein
VLGKLDGLVQGLAEIGEGGAEIACGEVIAKEERRYSLASLFSGFGLRFLLGVEAAEMRVTGAARSAALAAIGKGESTQTGTVFFIGSGRTDFFSCGRNTANGAFRGRESLLRIERFEL